MIGLKALLQYRRPVLLVHFIIVLSLLPGILQLKNDNSPEVFFVQDARALHQYQSFCLDFGGGKAIRIALNGPDLWPVEGLSWMGELEKKIALLPGVERVVGLAGLHQWLLLEWPLRHPSIFRTQVMENDLDRNAGWISPDGEIVTMLVVLADIPPKKIYTLLLHLDTLITGSGQKIQGHISGLPVLERAMDSILIKTTMVILPLLMGLAAMFLFLVFRRLRDVLGPLLFATLCQLILFGLMGYFDIRLNLVNILLAILIFVISLATAVHILIRCRNLEQQGMKTLPALLATYRGKRWPVLWTGITTLVAFGSLVTGNIPPIRSLGIWSAVGIALMTLLAFTFYPPLLATQGAGSTPQPVRPFEVWAHRWGKSLAHWAVHHRVLVLLSTTLLIIVALLGMLRFQIEDNLAKYFSPRNPIRYELERLQQHRVGVFAVELVLSYPNNQQNTKNEEELGFQNPGAQQKLAHLAALLRSHPLVYGAVCSGDLLNAAIGSMIQTDHISDNTRWLALGMMQTAPESRLLLHSLVTPNGLRARVTLLVPMLSFNQIQPLFQQARDVAKGIFPNAEIGITGQYPLILLAQEKLLWGVTVSLSLTLLFVIVVFYFILRNIPLTLLVVIPNIWPIILVLGGMGWLNIPLDSVSIMSASIILGLAVDDTFHTLSHFLRLKPRFGSARAIVATLTRTAPAHILTSLILTAGFLACACSDFLPVARLGALSSVAIIFALIGDLVLIPALLAKVNPVSHKETQALKE